MDLEKNELNYQELQEEEETEDREDQTSYCLILFTMYVMLLCAGVFLILLANFALNHSLDDLISYSPDDIKLLFYFATVILSHDCFIFIIVLILVYVLGLLKVISEQNEKEMYSLLLYLWFALLTCILVAVCYWVGQGIATGQIFVSFF